MTTESSLFDGNRIIVNPAGPGIGPNKATVTDHITLEASPVKPGRPLIDLPPKKMIAPLPVLAVMRPQCASRRSKKPSSNIAATPTQIALSATLKAGQCTEPTWKSRKSTTAPRRSRSMTLPTAPPMISPIARASNGLEARRSQYDQQCDDCGGGETENTAALNPAPPLNRPKLMPRL